MPEAVHTAFQVALRSFRSSPLSFRRDHSSLKPWMRDVIISVLTKVASCSILTKLHPAIFN